MRCGSHSGTLSFVTGGRQETQQSAMCSVVIGSIALLCERIRVLRRAWLFAFVLLAVRC